MIEMKKRQRTRCSFMFLMEKKVWSLGQSLNLDLLGYPRRATPYPKCGDGAVGNSPKERFTFSPFLCHFPSDLSCLETTSFKKMDSPDPPFCEEGCFVPFLQVLHIPTLFSFYWKFKQLIYRNWILLLSFFFYISNLKTQVW